MLVCCRTQSPAVSAVNQGNNNYVVTGKVDSFGDTLQDPRRFDSTGMFHWCVPQQLSACIIVSLHLNRFCIIEIATTLGFCLA